MGVVTLHQDPNMPEDFSIWESFSLASAWIEFTIMRDPRNQPDPPAIFRWSTDDPTEAQMGIRWLYLFDGYVWKKQDVWIQPYKVLGQKELDEMMEEFDV